MKDEIVTEDWSKFGDIEIEQAKELLSHCKEIDSCGVIKVLFNTYSGYVFLTDEDYRVWMMNDRKIEEFYSCSYCGNEGFKDELINNPCSESPECEKFIKNLKELDS